MPNKFKEKLITNIASVALIIGLLFQFIFLICNNINFFITNTMPDDAYYYMQIARNWSNGFGSTFDQMNLTNGYHPLWLYVLMPVFYIFSDFSNWDVIPLYTVLFICFIFSVGTGLILKKILEYLTNDKKIQAFVILSYFLNPFVLYNVFNGLETSFLLFVLSLFLLVNINLFKKEKICLEEKNLALPNFSQKKDFITLGIVSGFLVLVRLDMILVVIFSFLMLTIKFYKNYKNLFSMFLSFLIIYLPWQIYNYLQFKMFLTSASVTSTFVNHQLTYADNGGESLFLFLKTIIYNLDRAIGDFLIDIGNYYLFLPIIGLAVFYFFKKINNLNPERLNRLNFKNIYLFLLKYLSNPFIYIFLGLSSVIFISAGIRWTYRSWYFMPLVFISTFLYVFVLINLKKEFGNLSKYFLIVLIVFNFAFYYINWEKKLHDREIVQKQFVEAAKWQNENLPENSKLGVFNAGIQGYFSSHTVVNLDGLVNINASNAMLNRTLLEYIKQEKIEYISDIPTYMSYRYKMFFGDDIFKYLIPIKTFEGKKEVILYKTNF